MQGSRRRAVRLEVQRWSEGAPSAPQDVVALEEPLEIRIRAGAGERRIDRPVSVTMRTPGDDFELVAGFLLSEGIVRTARDLIDLRYCDEERPGEFNVVTATLRGPIDPALLTRNFQTTSSCGVCGTASIEAVEAQVGACTRHPRGERVLTPEAILDLPDRLREAQEVFDRTGGLHAAGLFDASGERVGVREDVGRHNAVDKIVGEALLKGRIPLDAHVLVVSGRTSFDLVQKTVVAGIPVLVAVGAPSSLAVDLARRFGVTLIGFVRNGAFNVYAAPERVGETG